MKLYERAPMPPVHVAITAALGLLEAGEEPEVKSFCGNTSLVFTSGKEELTVTGFPNGNTEAFIAANHRIGSDDCHFNHRLEDAKSLEMFEGLCLKATGKSWATLTEEARIVRKVVPL